MMYQAYQAHSDLSWPLRALSRHALPWLGSLSAAGLPDLGQRRAAAACRTYALSEVTHRRPAFGIDAVEVAGRRVAVTEEVVDRTPFCSLLRFRKDLGDDTVQPKVLLVAPMSGHFATLLRDTVRTMLADHEVYITDWHNARDVPLAAGRFGLDEYTGHLIRFLRVLGERANLMAICQPCVAALAAVSLMAEDQDPATPASLTLMAGPIDCRISPTEVNRLATSKDIGWFERHLIATVPWMHPGAGRRVYPGFVQLTAFMSMNRERHANAFREYYELLSLPEPDAEQLAKAEHTRAFYEEYLAVADLPAEFYLETVARVFQTYDLPKGELRVGERVVNPAAIRRTALLTVEGERDDICATGQTLAAQDLCSGLRPYLRTHYVQAGVGHYGVFSGRRWQNQIYPVVRDVIHVSQ
ncbi:polyhydroxyalkanoate depolymerase [Piscinibacter sakaiensis]|uniref:Poly-beta-hydroxyalkanoate depolymerase n=1 Tax=Piscinibacter sakaiensis TaxID=1547922 RepID=A0A0K8P5B7_PISS1|nr:polyhydroxyalkanoate depolymerase [Piscinibacter sakaiensis]GAP37400.1 poly-beta-hydroxyalkanoate depolymerase [Piscinibacter sakaiensis]